jgi:hypothetical protein
VLLADEFVVTCPIYKNDRRGSGIELVVNGAVSAPYPTT